MEVTGTIGAVPANMAYIPGLAVQVWVTAVAVTNREPAGAAMERVAKPLEAIAVPGGTSMRTPFGVSDAR